MTLIETEPRPRRTAGNDGALKDWVRALEATAAIAAQPRRILSTIVAEMAQSRGEAAALIGTQQTLSYRALAGRINRYARWALAQRLGKGETVCLFMPNRPDYMALWLGVGSVGGVVALLNTQIRGPSLAHCIDIVAPKHIVVADDLTEQFRSALPYLSTRPKVWLHGGGDDHPRIDRAIESLPDTALLAGEGRVVTIADRALLIYTSGTTGLPKAANVSHRRLLQWSLWFAGLMNTGPDDRMYDCLPMYHSVGGVVATGALLVRGGAVVLREKFSARQFWDDVCDHDCTLFQYIGELARYLVNAPSHPRERDHRLRLCAGNGLAADVWERFQQRFRIRRILEFYAATEGNVSLYNVEGRPGAIGRIPPFLKHRFPLALVQYDAETGARSRGADGFALRCATGEIGEALGRIDDGAAHAGAAFEGYTGREETERKILRNVFVPGDAWYRTGDLMRMDAQGFIYFIDRVGDTFRWKGENVATSDVGAAILDCPGIVDACVYGVAVPGTEGAAGMAALVTDGAFDLAAFRDHLARRLAAYARPLFLRLKNRIEVTGTFKQKKNELAREGFDPAATSDTLYFDDPEQQAYIRLDDALYARISAGDIRL